MAILNDILILIEETKTPVNPKKMSSNVKALIGTIILTGLSHGFEKTINNQVDRFYDSQQVRKDNIDRLNKILSTVK